MSASGRNGKHVSRHVPADEAEAYREAIPPGRLKSGRLKGQLFRAGASVAANYAEAEEPE